MLGGEATNTNFIVFGLTRPGLEPTKKHANHYATDTVSIIMSSLINVIDFTDRFSLMPVWMNMEISYF